MRGRLRWIRAARMRYEGRSEMANYTYTVLLARESNGYRAVCPALSGCRAFGDSRKEALQNIRISISHRLDRLRKKGMEIPKEERGK